MREDETKEDNEVDEKKNMDTTEQNNQQRIVDHVVPDESMLEDIPETKVIGTVRYDEDESEDIPETVSLFVKPRMTVQVEPVAEVRKEVETVKVNVVTKPAPPKKKSPILLILVIIVGLVIGFYIILAVIGLIATLVEGDSNNEVTDNQETGYVDESVEDNGDYSEEASSSGEFTTNNFYDEYTGISIDHPTSWSVETSSDGFIMLEEPISSDYILILGMPFSSVRSQFVPEATASEILYEYISQDMAYITENIGPISNYTESIQGEGEHIMITAEFMADMSETESRYYKMVKVIMNGYYASLTLETRVDSYNDSMNVFQYIEDNIVLPEY